MDLKDRKIIEDIMEDIDTARPRLDENGNPVHSYPPEPGVDPTCTKCGAFGPVEDFDECTNHDRKKFGPYFVKSDIPDIIPVVDEDGNQIGTAVKLSDKKFRQKLDDAKRKYGHK